MLFLDASFRTYLLQAYNFAAGREACFILLSLIRLQSHFMRALAYSLQRRARRDVDRKALPQCFSRVARKTLDIISRKRPAAFAIN